MSGELDSVIQPLINEHQADLLVGLSMRDNELFNWPSPKYVANT